jgi:hypothetical protein
MGFLRPGNHIRREQGAGAVILLGILLGIQPTACGKGVANFSLEADFLVQAH